MANKIEIINMALRRIYEQPINAIDEGSEASNIVSDMYNIALDSELRIWPWTWAIKNKELAQSGSGDTEFGYSFQLPSDYVKITKILSPNNGTTYYSWEPWDRNATKFSYEWEIQRDQLFLNADAVEIKYVFLETDTTKWDPSFVDAFAWRLAYELALPITGREDIAAHAEKNYFVAMGRARQTNGAETRRRNHVSTNYLRARTI